MRIFSWNIRQGGGSRTEGICGVLDEIAADALVLSEFRNNRHGDVLREHLVKTGYQTLISPDCDPKLNSVLLASKKVGEAATFPDSDPEFPHCVARIRLKKLDLYGVYLPHKKKHGLFPYLESHLAGGPPSVIAGDFNTGQNFIDQKGKTFWYTRELQHLSTLSYVDAFRHLHGKLKREYSWFSHGGNGFRYDHTWMASSLAKDLTSCDYLHDPRESGLSDHSPMLVEL